VRRLLVLLAATTAALACASTVHARPLSTEAPELEAVASMIAGQPLEVRCWVNDGSDPDADVSAWGYVYLRTPIVYLDPAPCAGAQALAAGAMLPLWQLALGALVLTHESYHLKTSLPYWRRGDEAQTECRAIKRVYQTMLDLGISTDLADAILPWAIAEHFKIETLADGAYNYPSCAVPVFADFWP
jgi:hypothetical protein